MIDHDAARRVNAEFDAALSEYMGEWEASLRARLGRKADVGEACVPNAGGKGHHDDQTGYPCTTGADPGPQQPGLKHRAALALKDLGDAWQEKYAKATGSLAAKVLKSAGGMTAQGAGKVRDKAVNKFKGLQEKYGTAGAIAVLSATLAIVAAPLPGTALAAPLPGYVADAVVWSLKKAGVMRGADANG